MFPCLPRDVEAELRNEEIYKADLWNKKSAGDIECLELLCVAPAMNGCVAVADCLNYFNDGHEITVGIQLMFDMLAEGCSFIIGKLNELSPKGDARIIMTGAPLIPMIGSAIHFRVELSVNQVIDNIVSADCVPASFFA